MLVTQDTFIFNTLPPYLFHIKNGTKFRPTLAQKRDASKNSSTQQQQSILPLRVSNTILARSAIAVLGLGFIDAGYSGDWSRIGVISKETEDFLKLSALLVVPLCLFLIFSISKEPED
ncbi:uncharacterized protein LOC117925519 [Vitis riparia]|uniref:uncharacterized protein LOC117925519 n=1 Tax=Vitis riparia TaxID=96939 RepID=UPI00155B2F10|nr:uncharacterized protein LOC117925519 [Vitis riparia]